MPRSELHVAWKHRKRQWETQRGVTCDGSRVWKKDGDVQELNVQRELTNVFSEERPLPQKHINKIWNHLEGLWTSVSLVIVSVKTLERFFSELHTAMKGHNWIQSTFNFEDFFQVCFLCMKSPFQVYIEICCGARILQSARADGRNKYLTLSEQNLFYSFKRALAMS